MGDAVPIGAGGTRARPKGKPRGRPLQKGETLPGATPWKKGQSGNPRGMSKEQASVRDQAQRMAAEALQALGDIMRDPSASASARVQAAQAIIDRGHGRPVQATEITGADGGPVKMLSWAETLTAAAEAVHEAGG